MIIKNYKYQENDFFIGIEDGGYEIIKRGFSLDLAVGDFDTTSHLSEISASAKQILKYSPIKNEVLIHPTTVMNLKNIFLHKTGKKQKTHTA